MKWKIFCGFKKVLFVVGGGCFFILIVFFVFLSRILLRL